MSPTVFIICAPSMGFPEGMAATARVRQYANAFRDSHYSVMVICPAPSEPTAASARNVAPVGSIEGIDFWYPSGSTVRSSSFVVRRLRAIRSWIRILNAMVRSRPIAVLVYPMTATVSILVSPLARLLGVRVLCDQSELPSVHTGVGAGGALRLRMKLRGMRRSDGVIAITQVIADHVEPIVNPTPVTVIPVMIDTADFAMAECASNAAERNTRNIVYTGPLNDHKDGAGALIEAFAMVHQVHAETRLLLVGESIPERIAHYRAVAHAKEVEPAVTFMGRVPRSELLSVLASAAVLALPRPNTEQNRANMPTKLVEYLATGRPVVATSVGLVTDMVDPTTDAILVPAGDPAALASGILRILEDPESSHAMAESGRRRAQTTFDYRAYRDVLDGMTLGENRS